VITSQVDFLLTKDERNLIAAVVLSDLLDESCRIYASFEHHGAQDFLEGLLPCSAQ